MSMDVADSSAGVPLMANSWNSELNSMNCSPELSKIRSRETSSNACDILPWVIESL